MALVFPFLILCITFLMYVGFLTHNKAILEEAAYEAAHYAATLYKCSDDEQKQAAENRFGEITKGRLFDCKSMMFHVTAEQGDISVSVEMQMEGWPFLNNLRNNMNLDKVSVQAREESIYPLRVIWLADIFV